MDPRQELYVLVTQKLWSVGAEAMDLLVVLCHIVEPSISGDSIVPALTTMFSELPQWLENTSEEELLKLAEAPPAQAVHFRLLLALRGLGLFLEGVTGRHLELFYTLLPQGQHDYRLEFVLAVQQVVCSWSHDRIIEMRNMLSPLPEHMRQHQVLCMNPEIQYETLELVSRILCLEEQELSLLLDWFPSLTQKTMSQFISLVSEVPFEALVELRSRLSREPEVVVKEEPGDASCTSSDFPSLGASGSGFPPPPSPVFDPLADVQPLMEMHDTGGPSPHMGALQPVRLRIIEQPPSQTVYQRLLKPHPKVMLENATSDDLWVEAVLIRQDSDRPIDAKGLDGTTVHHIAQGKVAVFGKLKLLFTSQQQGTLFRIKFVLKRYTGHGFEELPSGSVISNPVEVFSHSVYIRRPRHATPPMITEVLPPVAMAGQRCRLCVIGSNFNNSITISVRIGDRVMTGDDAMFHGTGTLLVNAPPLPPGEYDLSASNDGTHYCEPVRFTVHG